MKQSKSFLTRCLALALALVLLASSANLGAALQVFAAEGDKTSVTIAELVADNYELTDAEKALLKSGNLVGGTYEYDVPTNDDNLVAVDTEAKKITAEEFGEWVPTAATIVVSENEKYDVTLTNGEGTYTYAGNAFSVKVTYELNHTVDAATQEILLKAAANLKTGLDEMEAVYKNVDANLGTIVLAMPTLVDLANGIDFKLGPLEKHLILETEAAIAAVKSLNAQLDDNMLDLQEKNAAYYASESKVQYMVENGGAYKKAVEETYSNLKAINEDPFLRNQNILDYLEITDPTQLTKWNTFLSILGNTVSALDAVSSSWDTSAVAEGADYAELDALVAALSTTTTSTVKNPLYVATATVQKNLSMYNVEVSVKLQTVENKADSTVLVENEHVETVTVTLGKGATAAEIIAAIEKSGVEGKAQTAWGEAYVEGHFVGEGGTLPETLTEDIEFVITYAPKTYTVTYGEGFVGAEADKVPYGYQLTLEKHSDATKAYDYTVNGETLAQGTVYTVVGDTAVSRAAGKAYNVYNLYTLIADNYGDDVMKAILKSGVLDGNKTIIVREPDPTDVDTLIKLDAGVMNAVAEYPADYAGLNWAPYSYTAGETTKLFNGKYDITGLTAKQIGVKYRLNLTNYSAADVQKILNAAAALVTEAGTQTAALNRLVGHYDAMGSLDKTKLGALNGVIDVTDLHTDPDKNAALKAEFKTIVSAIINNNLDGSTLKIYNMLTEYQKEATGGLTYYYANAEAVINEVAALSEYLNGLVDSDEKLAALEILCVAAEYPEYKDKIAELGTVMAEVKEALTAPNAIIDLGNSNLYKLIDVLEAGKPAGTVGTVASPYLDSKTLNATDNSTVTVQIIVTAGGAEETFATAAFDRGYVLAQGDVNALIASANAFAAEKVGADKIAYYKANGVSELSALVGTTLLDKLTTIEITYVPTSYTVKVEGGDSFQVTIDDLAITLPAHTKPGHVYIYNVFGAEVEVSATAGNYTLTPEQLDQIENGSYTITRKEINKDAENLDQETQDNEVLTLIKDSDGDITGIVANVAPNQASLTKFATELTELGYSYAELNDEALLELSDDDSTQIWLQTLINAVLADEDFSSELLIQLGNEGKGTLFTATMDLGNAEDDIRFAGIDFTFNMTSVPAQMVDVANGLDAVKNYMTFNAQDGLLNVELNLPEKVYEIYLAALLATGELDGADMNAINNEIAFTFLYDYLDLIKETNATAQSFQNTLDMLYNTADNVVDGEKLPEIDLTKYSAYYDMLKKALTADGLEINPEVGEDPVEIGVTAAGKTAIDRLMGVMGLNPADFGLELAMIADYKEGNSLNVNVIASLENTGKNFEAAIFDLDALKAGVKDLKDEVTKNKLVGLVQGKGAANGIDFTDDLIERMSTVTGNAVVVLLGDVEGDLYFKAGSILDLNGYTIDGDVTANGPLYIFDSTLSTYDCGTVTGAVNGNVCILAGHYPNDDVTEYLKDGYYQNENGIVQNALYTIERNGTDLTFVINSDYMYEECVEGYLPSVRALAADITMDLATKYFAPAALSIEGYSIYNINFDKLIDLLNSSEKIDDVISKVVDCFSAEALTGFANELIDDLTDFGAMKTALENDEVIGDYLLTTTPWTVALQHVTDSDHVDIGIGASTDASLNKNVNVGLKIVGTNKDLLLDLLCELRDILSLDASVDLKKPVYDGENNTLSVAGNASTTLTADLTASCTYSNTDYITIFTVLFANANADANTAAMVEALNAGDMDAVKDAFDEMTVEDVFTAMKKLNKTDDFAKLAANVGVTVDVAAADELENLYHLIICATGKVLERFEITGLDKKLGNLDKDDNGIYELTFTASRKGDVSRRGYTVDYNVENVTVSLKVIIFPCKLGDVNHDGKINAKDAALIAQYSVNKLPENQFFCNYGANVNTDSKINAKDAALIAQYSVEKISSFPAEK